MKSKKVTRILALGIGIMFLGATLTGCGVSQKKYNDDIKAQQSIVAEKEASIGNLNQEVGRLEKEIETLKNVLENRPTEDEMKNLQNELDAKKQKLEIKQAELDKYKLTPEEVTQLQEDLKYAQDQLVEERESDAVDELGFDIEDVNLRGNFETSEIDNNDLNKLIDDEIEYDGKDYDVEELVEITPDVKVLTNEFDDFGADISIGVLAKNAIKYKYSFKDPIKLVNDEDLDIVFLGKDMTITSFDDEEISYLVSEKSMMTLGETITVDGTEITFIGVEDNDEANKIQLSVNGVVKTIEEGKMKSFDEFDIKVDEVFISNIGEEKAFATLYIGDDIVETAVDGKDYEPDDRFKWIVEFNENSELVTLGLFLDEKLDDDDEVLKLGDTFSFPNDYLVFKFSDLKELDVFDLNIDVGSNDEIEFSFDGDIEIDGDKIDSDSFTINLDENYTITYPGIDEDDEYVFTDEDVLFIVDDRELKLSVTDDTISIDNIYNFSYNGNNELTTELTFYDDKDFRMDNGDILYQSDINEDDEEVDEVTIGLVNDEDKEVILTIY
ncbi:hypothetical protein DRN69_00595 [Candidatus Pacearchaeota archaeon]|nr:MAG: hypothetical protein DRN69_00595 [Candidatus Pacearchaeota archaeon]